MGKNNRHRANARTTHLRICNACVSVDARQFSEYGNRSPYLSLKDSPLGTCRCNDLMRLAIEFSAVIEKRIQLQCFVEDSMGTKLEAARSVRRASRVGEHNHTIFFF